MTNKTLYLLGGLGVLGGVAYYATTRKATPKPSNGVCPPGFHMMPDGTCMADVDMPAPAADLPPLPGGQSLPAYIDPNMVELYTKCYEQGCSLAEYQQIQAYLTQLATQYPVDQALWQWFAGQLAAQRGGDYGGGTSTIPDLSAVSAGLGLNFGGAQPTQETNAVPWFPIPTDLTPEQAVQYLKCWNYNCSPDELQAMGTMLSMLMAGLEARALTQPQGSPHRINLTERYRAAMLARDELFKRVNAMAGRSTMGRHVGACSCEQRQEEIGVGACCDACERGEECSECGEHKPTVG